MTNISNLSPLDEGKEIIDVLWDEFDMDSFILPRDEAYFMWETDPNFKRETMNLYKEFIDVMSREMARKRGV